MTLLVLLAALALASSSHHAIDHAVGGANFLCTPCKQAVLDARTFLKKHPNATAQIIAAAGALCSKLPPAYVPMCDTGVNVELPKFFKNLMTEDPATFCGPAMCESVLPLMQSIVQAEQGKISPALVKEADKLCGILHQKWPASTNVTACEDTFAAAVPKLLQWFIALNSQQACTNAFCPSASRAALAFLKKKLKQ